MRHVLALLLLGAAGCHVPSFHDPYPQPGPSRTVYGGSSTVHGGSSPGYGYDSRRSTRPLRATLRFDEYTGYAAFDLNRPAHVAIFAIRPLGGIEMIYPGYGWGDTRAFRSGGHAVRTYSHQYDLTRGSHYGQYGSATHASRSATYIVLIASERPLRLEPLMATGTLPWLGHPSVTWNPFTATDRIAREIVPSRGTTEWTVAYHVIWPEARFHRAHHGRIPTTRVLCPGNRVVVVSTEALRNGWFHCPDPYGRPPGHGTRATVDSAVVDAPRITETLTKRPRPADPGNATPEHGSPAPAFGDRLRDAPRPERPATPVTPTRARPERPVTTRPAWPRPRQRAVVTEPAERSERTVTRTWTPPERWVRSNPVAPATRPTRVRPRTPTPRPTARPARTTRQPAVRRTPRPQPRPRPRPKPKPKEGSGGGG